MSRSWNLARPHFWHVLGTIFVAGLITGFISGIIGAFGVHNWFLGWIFGSIGSIITIPYLVAVTVLLYLDLRTRVEMLTSDRLRSELAQT
jgi:NhaP-type Na+/H+ or K+/H+ antiporter